MASRWGRVTSAFSTTWPRLRRKHDGRITVTLTLVACAALATVVGALVARELPWTWRPTIALAAVSHQLLWAAPVAVVLFAITRHFLGLALAVIALVLAVVSQAGLYLAGFADDNGPRVVVLQANLGVGHADADAFVRLVRDRHVDIATTEELTADEVGRLDAAGLSQLLPYRFAAPGPDATGLAIWSRYPLLDEINYHDFDFGTLSAHVKVDGRDVVVVAAHPVPPYPKPAAQWRADMHRLRGILQAFESSGPLIVGGDFNATADNPQFRALTKGELNDAANASGAGYLPTYPTDHWFGPVIAIDHILVAHLGVASLRAVSLPGSDHRGLLADVPV